MFDVRGTHGLSCKRSAGRATRHHHLNDLVYRVLVRAGIPSVKEPCGLDRTDGKRPDGLTLVPWQGGRSMAWDVTVVDTQAPPYVRDSAAVGGSAAERAAVRKTAKYVDIAVNNDFIPLACETLGPINSKGLQFFQEVGRRTTVITGEPRETCFLLQRLSVLIQRFNAVATRGTFPQDPDTNT